MSIPIATLFVLACGTTAPEGPAVAPPPVSTPDPNPAPVPDDHADHDAAAGATMTHAPDTLAATVAALDAHRDEIAALVEAGKLGEVHPHTEQMEGLAVQLPVRAKELSPEERNKVTVAATGLKKVLDAVHHAADEGNVEETKAELLHLDEQLHKLAPYE